MKTKPAHRRKLRFSSTKTATPMVTVKVEQAPQRPIKRRKRQHRVNAVPNSTVRPVNSLPVAISSGIQDRFAAAKSLGEITLTVLQIFKEHESLQRSVSGPVFPILVPTSEIYKMKVPRKRRIYDVLHVLEGIGVIKRARYNESRNAKAEYFRYYGEAAVVQHLEGMKATATQVVVGFRQSHRSMRSGMVEEDRALVKIFEDQGILEKWPCLVTMTACFLGLMFQQDHGGVGLSTISDRIFEAKKAIAVAPGSTTEMACSDVQRRVYDVVSVMGSCNIIDTSLVNSPNFVDKCLRKHVRFNYDIFTNPRLLFAIPASDLNGTNATSSVPLFDGMAISLRGLKSPQSGLSDHQLISPPLTYWQNLHDATVLITSPTFPPVSASVHDTTSWGLFISDESQREAVTSQSSSLLTPDNFVRCPPQAQAPPRVHKFFSPFGMASTTKNEWCDESLKHLGLHDALPAEDNIDWELNKLFKENYREMWGYQSPISSAPDHQLLVDKAAAKVKDLECLEVLGDNINYFC